MRCNISSKRRNRQFRRAHDDADRHGRVEEHSHCVFVGFVVNLHNGNTPARLHCGLAWRIEAAAQTVGGEYYMSTWSSTTSRLVTDLHDVRWPRIGLGVVELAAGAECQCGGCR